MYTYNEEYIPQTIVLKNNVVTTDPRLDRIQQFDERSRNYRIEESVRSKKPRSFTWSCELFLDQRKEGACGGFAGAHELGARPVVIAVTELQARKIYYRAQQLDPWPGGEYEGASPRYAGTSILAVCKAMQELKTVGGAPIMPEYRWAFGLEDMVLAVGYKGPVIIGVNWYTGMFTPDEKGFIHVDGAIAGGHATLVNAVRIVWKENSQKQSIADVDLEKSYFTIHNSWGEKWGKKGKCKISLADMQRLLSEQGECVIPVVRLGKKNKNRKLDI